MCEGNCKIGGNNEVTCSCTLGRGCLCTHIKTHPGDTLYTCPDCGSFVAGAPFCDKCEVEVSEVD